MFLRGKIILVNFVYMTKLSIMSESNRAHVRVAKELERLKHSPPMGIFMWPLDDNLESLEATIEGLKDSPYEGGEFRLSITIPPKYPNVPPTIKFKTPIYHPNIDSSGRICLDFLKPQPQGKWTATVSLEMLLTQIQQLMADPNPTDPLDGQIASEFLENKQVFLEKARNWTKLHAIPKSLSNTDNAQINCDESD